MDLGFKHGQACNKISQQKANSLYIEVMEVMDLEVPASTPLWILFDPVPVARCFVGLGSIKASSAGAIPQSWSVPDIVTKHGRTMKNM